MNTRPIKRNINIRKLSRDHHHTLLFCWKIREGLKNKIPAERIVKFVEYFRETCLQQHFYREEKYLFVYLNDPKVDRAIMEHGQINKLMLGVPGLKESRQMTTLVSLTDLMEAHIRYEERELFPFFEKNLNSTQLEKIGQELGSEEMTKADDFEDPFWVQKA
jgi:hemerythrin-like domain-containing protein